MVYDLGNGGELGARLVFRVSVRQLQTALVHESISVPDGRERPRSIRLEESEVEDHLALLAIWPERAPQSDREAVVKRRATEDAIGGG